MTATIERVTQLSQLTAIKAKEQLDVAIELVRRARTLSDVLSIRDANVQMEAFLRTRRAAVAMGDEIESLRAKLREISLECELQQGRITAALPHEEKIEAVKSLGVTRKQAAHCELAATLPRQTVDAVRCIQRRKGLDVRAADLAPLAPLTTESRKLVASQLGDVRGVKEALEKAKVLPSWPPSGAQEKSKRAVVDLSAIRCAARTRDLRIAANGLVLQAERYASRKTDELRSLLQQQQDLVIRLTNALGNPEK
jgi:hypothetical protein